MMAVALGKQLSAMSTSGKAPPRPVLAAYGCFFVATCWLYHLVMDEDAFSAIITVAEMLQCLALLLLAAQVLSTGSAAGISARAVGLEALALVCRLSSTLWLNGYLPVDESGDWFYQGVDLCALATACWLLYQVLVVHASSFQGDADTFPVLPVVAVCFVLASLLHADMNLRPVFDTLWMTSVFLGAVAVMPQLWLIMRTGGRVQALMSHNIAAMAIGRALGGYFMWLAREEVTSQPWIEGINHAILAILGAHLLHAILLADFAYVYVKAVSKQGLQCELVLDDCTLIV
eukprot:TRINITY_DN65857_c0_g1_i1.p1 TRINITY_DN65857_c0_g1~~TRINITY_DN65857_c0_g1_i1.p1  ORF type:complete len:289 (-),score=63.42 TRINITY_DN65857_c0_g1_i1:74-940(-)